MDHSPGRLLEFMKEQAGWTTCWQSTEATRPAVSRLAGLLLSSTDATLGHLRLFASLYLLQSILMHPPHTCLLLAGISLRATLPHHRTTLRPCAAVRQSSLLCQVRWRSASEALPPPASSCTMLTFQGHIARHMTTVGDAVKVRRQRCIITMSECRHMLRLVDCGAVKFDSNSHLVGSFEASLV